MKLDSMIDYPAITRGVDARENNSGESRPIVVVGLSAELANMLVDRGFTGGFALILRLDAEEIPEVDNARDGIECVYEPVRTANCSNERLRTTSCGCHFRTDPLRTTSCGCHFRTGSHDLYIVQPRGPSTNNSNDLHNLKQNKQQHDIRQLHQRPPQPQASPLY